MIRRIELILKTQNITPAQFADRLGVQRSGLSHILSGRNKPSLDFILKVLKLFPDIKPDWLLFGNGSMYYESSLLSAQIPSSGSISNQPSMKPSGELSNSFSAVSSAATPNPLQETTSGASHSSHAALGQTSLFDLETPDTPNKDSFHQNMEASVPFVRSEPRAYYGKDKDLSDIFEMEKEDINDEASDQEIEQIVFFYKNGSFRTYRNT